MVGAGKTTLLHHLGYWWQTTGFVKHVFSFDYDRQAWTRQEIFASIARILLTEVEYMRDFELLPLDEQQALLTERLHATRHLLILDNLESITGAQLAIQHTLPQDEQTVLHSFLTGCANGRTFVLLGSRGSEDWLAKGTFDDNVYDLSGLDSEAASILTNLILEKCNATKYRADFHLCQLFKQLGGFPLALEGVLANLAHRSPKDVIAALQSGDMSIDPGSNSRQKKESILRRIDSSYSHLSPSAQQLLACLTPFTSVIWQDGLDIYTEVLQQQPALKDLPFERWQETIDQAKNWGLLHAHEQLPQILKLHPLLPYFLRVRLASPEGQAILAGVETAFREYYLDFSTQLVHFFSSNAPKQRLSVQAQMKLEYENFVTALNFAVRSHTSITILYTTLVQYLDAVQDRRRAVELGQFLLKQLQDTYSQEELQGPLGNELVNLLMEMASQQLRLKDHTDAKAAYHKCLQILESSEPNDESEQRKLKEASIYYGLGIVAEDSSDTGGVLREDKGVAAKVLTNLGVELNKVRSAVELIIGRGDRIVESSIGLTPYAKKAIELAVDEARSMNHHYIGTEHLLLGLIREGEGIAAGVLESLGVNLEQVHTQTIQALSQSSTLREESDTKSPVPSPPDEKREGQTSE